MKGNISARLHLVDTWTSLALGLGLVLVLALFGNHALNRSVSYDGAMNYQVSKSLADGKGYVRDYQGTRPFPREVQSNAPLTVPGAAVIKVAGVGYWQTQIVNFVYLCGLLALLVILLVKLHESYFAGLVMALICLITPGFTHIGMNGWGEVIALFWWLAGTILMLGEKWGSGRNARIMIGAMFLGLSLVAKTVLLIGICGTFAAYGLTVFVNCRRGIKQFASAIALPCLAFLLPIFLNESWKLVELSGLTGYLAWWQDQSGAIVWQTGVTQDTSAGLLSKSLSHFGTLSKLVALPKPLLALWIALPIALSALALSRNPTGSARQRIWLAVLLIVAVYFVWWLAITPDTHTRLRRILCGLILLQMLWLFCAGWLWEKLQSRHTLQRVLLFAGFVAVPLLVNISFASSFTKSFRGMLSDAPDQFVPFIESVKKLPPNAMLFGKGFLSSPQIGLYADRKHYDLDLFTSGDLQKIGVGYLSIDPPAAQSRRFAPELRRYAHTDYARHGNFRIVKVDFRQRKNPFQTGNIDRAHVMSYVDFTTMKYAHVFGMHRPDRKGWRWATTDAEVLLKYDGSSHVGLVSFLPNRRLSRPQKPLTVTFTLDGCAVGRAPLEFGLHRLALPIPESCRPKPGQLVRLGITSDNMQLLDARNQRQMSYVANSVGFTDPNNSVPTQP